MTLIIILLGCCDKGIDITVKKGMITKLEKYHMATIVVQDYKYGNDSAKTDIMPSNTKTFIEMELQRQLKEIRLEITDEKVPVDIQVLCMYRQSIGCPYLGRHLTIGLKHMSYVNLKVIDAKTKEIIGEVECTRPSCAMLPPTFIELMIEQMIKGST